MIVDKAFVLVAVCGLLSVVCRRGCSLSFVVAVDMHCCLFVNVVVCCCCSLFVCRLMVGVVACCFLWNVVG